MKCKNCKYYGEKLDWFEPKDGVDVRFCKNPMICRPTHGNPEETIMKKDGVLTMDEGGCTDQLCVGPDFGCIHFEARD